MAQNANSRINKHHANFLRKWWLLSYPRAELIKAIGQLPRYAACVRVTKRPIFAFLHPSIHPGDALQVFVAADDYSFGIVQSDIHWQWFVARCSTMKRDFRYTSDTVFDTFPWPQTPSIKQVRAIADAAIALRAGRQKAMGASRGLRELYRMMELPGANPLKDLHVALDEAVKAAYNIGKRDDPLEFLLNLNEELAAAEVDGKEIVRPGFPSIIKDPTPYITPDCITP